MSYSLIADGTNDVSGDIEGEEVETRIVHNMGVMEGPSGEVTSRDVMVPRYFQTMPENNLMDFLTRPMEVRSYTLNNTDSFLVPLGTTDVWQSYCTNAQVLEKMDNYTYVRGTLEVIAMVAVPGNCYGSYIFSALPDAGVDPSGSTVFSSTLKPENCMQVDHYCRIDLANSENVRMELPFIYPFDFARISDIIAGTAKIWNVTLTCLAPISTAIPSGVQVGNIRLFARLLPGYELCVSRFNGKKKKQPVVEESEESVHYGSSDEDMTAEQVEAIARKQRQSIKRASNAKPKGAISGAAGVVADVASKMSSIPVIGAYAAPAAKVAETIGSLASMFGFTRENDPQTPGPITMRSVTNLAPVDCHDASDPASLSANNAISIDPTMSGGRPEDCLSCEDLFKRWTVVKQFTWTDSQAYGTILANWPVSPSYCRGSNTNVQLTTAGWYGLPFAYWSGDMEYLIIFPVSKLHRGDVQILWVPSGSITTAASTNTALNILKDITTGEECQFTVGFAKDVPVCYNQLIIDTSVLNYSWQNGTVYVKVINPLQAQTTSVVTCTVFARAKPNMSFHVPRELIRFPSTLFPEVTLDYLHYQGKLKASGAAGDEESHETPSEVLVKPSAAIPLKELYFGEGTVNFSVRAMLQKPSRICFTAARAYSGSKPQYYLLPPLGPNNNDNIFTRKMFSYVKWYKGAYIGLAASERIKLVSSNPAAADLAATQDNYYASAFPYIPGPTTPTGVLPSSFQLAPMTCVGQNRGAEWVIPYYTPRKFVSCRQDFTDVVALYRFTGFNHTKGLNNGANLINEGMVYHSLGPDIRAVGFRQIPNVIFDPAFVPQNWWLIAN